MLTGRGMTGVGGHALQIAIASAQTPGLIYLVDPAAGTPAGIVRAPDPVAAARSGSTMVLAGDVLFVQCNLTGSKVPPPAPPLSLNPLRALHSPCLWLDTVWEICLPVDSAHVKLFVR